MGTLTGTVLVGRARRLLLDVSSVAQRWADAELLDAINEGQYEMVGIKPDIKPVHATISLAAGPRQVLPSDAVHFIKVTRNSNGYVPAYITDEDLTRVCPSWGGVSGTQVDRFLFDDNDNTAFYVFPQVTGGSIQVLYAAYPTPLATLASAIDVPDSYGGALVNYICYRALQQDMLNPQNKVLADSHYQAFAMAVGGRMQAEPGMSATAQRQSVVST